jgi:hypothetical protein
MAVWSSHGLSLFLLSLCLWLVGFGLGRWVNGTVGTLGTLHEVGRRRRRVNCTLQRMLIKVGSICLLLVVVGRLLRGQLSVLGDKTQYDGLTMSRNRLTVLSRSLPPSNSNRKRYAVNSGSKSCCWEAACEHHRRQRSLRAGVPRLLQLGFRAQGPHMNNR